jgi:phosphoribosylformylglycinamidine synthase
MSLHTVIVRKKPGAVKPNDNYRKIWQELGLPGDPDIETATLYRFEGINKSEANLLAREALTDPVTQEYSINSDLLSDRKIEIGYKRGVMNPVEESLQIISQAFGIRPEAVSQSRVFYFRGHVRQKDIEAFASTLPSQVEQLIRKKPKTLKISGAAGPVERIPVASLTDGELNNLSGRRRLFLDLKEMQVVAGHFRIINREPTDVELETLAQTWSEHNGHKTFKAKLVDPDGKVKSPLITRIKKTSRRHFKRAGVVTAFADNAGGFSFYDGMAVIAKGETHNSPVAVEPYGGALTKNGGVYRDIAGCGLGGQNLLGIMVNCMGDFQQDRDKVPSGSLHPRKLLLENSRGERDYGNRMGIPTHQLNLRFHPDFGPKPTSMGIVVGMIPGRFAKKRTPRPGDFLFTIGGKTGRDGIHGATFSSAEMTAETSTVDATAVQIGNAIEEKRMFDALIRCRNLGLIRTITDCGGGGYSSAVGEMGQKTGVTVDLSSVPLKYSGLSPWEIWLSESQERMIAAVCPKKAKQFSRILADYDVPADKIGKFTGSRKLKLIFRKKTVADLPMKFLHEGLPQRVMDFKYVPYPEKRQLPKYPVNWKSVLVGVLGHGNLASVELLLRQYDNTVQGMTVMGPFIGINQDIPAEASVVAPLPGKPYGVVTTSALHPLLNRINPASGTRWAAVSALSRLTAAGGNFKKAALIDNFVWPKPDAKFLGDLDLSVDELCKVMDVFGVPCVSGKDSLSSTFTHKDGRKIHIPPVLAITAFGKIPDVKKTVTPDIKESDSVLALVGEPDWHNLGGSTYFEFMKLDDSHPPEILLEKLPEIFSVMQEAIASGSVLSAKAVGEGGLAAAVTLMCIGGGYGAELNLGDSGNFRPDLALFAESAGCFVVEVKNNNTASRLFSGVPYRLIGRTSKEASLSVTANGNRLFRITLDLIKSAWQKPFREVIHS